MAYIDYPQDTIPGLPLFPAASTCGCDGLGLFDSGLDLTQWGWAEWGIALVAVWGLTSMFSTGRSGYRKVSKVVRRRRSRAQRKADLRRQLQEA